MRIKKNGKKYGMPELADGIYSGTIVDCDIQKFTNQFGNSQYKVIPHIELDIEGRTVLYRGGILFEGTELIDAFFKPAHIDSDGFYVAESIIGKTCNIELETRTSLNGKEYLAISNIEYPELLQGED
jgi:hypothetical protein